MWTVMTMMMNESDETAFVTEPGEIQIACPEALALGCCVSRNILYGKSDIYMSKDLTQLEC
jgi:hypothetical protein